MGKNKDLQKMLTEFEKEFGHIKEWEIERDERLRAQSKDAGKLGAITLHKNHKNKWKEGSKKGGITQGNINVENGHLQSISSKGGKAHIESGHLDKIRHIAHEACSIPILQYDKQGNFIKEWKSAAEAARAVGTTPQNINLVLNPKKKNKTAAGFIWKYKDE